MSQSFADFPAFYIDRPTGLFRLFIQLLRDRLMNMGKSTMLLNLSMFTDIF